MAHHLVIQLARFGDTIQTKRLLLSLAATPGDTVHLAVDPSLAPFARLIYPFAVVHEVLAHATNLTAAEAFSGNRNVFAALAEIPFASVYILNFSGMALALAGLFDPDSVRGYSSENGQAFRSRWLRMGFRWMANRRIAPLNLVDFWAYLHPNPVAPASVNPDAAPWPEAKAGDGKGIAVVAAGREARRSLPPEVLAPLVEAAFVAHGGPKIVILGGSAERVFARKLSRLLRPAVLQKVEDACGRTSLTDLPDIFAGCGLALTPDTGLMHLAAHMGVPVQAFFLSSAWCFETGPYGDGHTVFQATRSCAPCVETRPCPHAVACLSPYRGAVCRDTSSGIVFARGAGQKSLARSCKNVPSLSDDKPRPYTRCDSWPENLAQLRTRCDAFGCDYLLEKGEVPELTSRAALRSLLAEYCGKGAAGESASRFAETVFHETDWMVREGV